MTVRVNVDGGTNAGSKRPPAAPAAQWVHLCPAQLDAGLPRSVVLSGHFRNCPGCYRPRPQVTS